MSTVGGRCRSPTLRQLGFEARLGTCQRLRANDVDDVAMSLGPTFAAKAYQEKQKIHRSHIFIHNGTPYNQTKTLWILYPEDRKCEKYRSKGYIQAAHELQQSPKNMWNLSRKRTSSSCLSRCGSRRVEVEDLKSSWDETLYIDSEDIRHRWKARWFRGGDQQAIQLLCLQESDETAKHSEVAPLPEKTMEDNLFKVRNEWPIIELLRFDTL